MNLIRHKIFYTSGYFGIRAKILTLIIFSFQFLFIKAQQSSTLYFMYTLPESNLLNPAVQIPCKVFVGMPLLSSIHLNYSNTFFSYNDLISHSANDSLKINANYFLTKPGTRQDIETEFQISLLNFGFRYKEYYFNFNLSDKMDLGLFYPTNWFQFILKGNSNYAGQTLSLGGAGVYGNYYREWAFGVSKIIDEKFTFGVKAKLLFGKANLTTSQSDLGLNTALPVFYLTGTSKFSINGSPISLKIDPNGVLKSVDLPGSNDPLSLLLNRQNKGFAADFGVIYKIDNKITLSGSVLDLGFIHWKYAPEKINESGSFVYKGFVVNSKTFSISNFQQIIDSLKSSYKFSTSASAYNTFLSPIMYLGGTYNFTRSINAGLMARNELYHGKLLTSVSASVNAWYSKYFAASLSWSYINNSLDNLGAGISMRTPAFGLYVISDNVYGAFKYKSARFLNIRFGINFLFGCSSGVNIKKMLAKKGCEIYHESDEKNLKFNKWKERLKKLKKKKK